MTSDSGTTVSPTRIDLPSLTADAYGAMVAFGNAARGPLEPRLVNLVQLRASQINGCRFCIGLHTTTARNAGETEIRLATLVDWRAQPHFTERERAALGVTETVTLITGPDHRDEVLHHAAQHFTPTEVGYLLWIIAAINAWNRVAIASHMADADILQA